MLEAGVPNVHAPRYYMFQLILIRYVSKLNFIFSQIWILNVNN